MDNGNTTSVGSPSFTPCSDHCKSEFILCTKTRRVSQPSSTNHPSSPPIFSQISPQILSIFCNQTKHLPNCNQCHLSSSCVLFHCIIAK
ncbi:hypothetical protein L1987_73386 [Smallanthus sonchifolius]|uniref:Uncharacterized protein n=1 Tax=Smallanthus sonchifolius TaxID=185202 RepID=A0ACB8ZZS3_9ASTR|nr:hypothetical protein L1987_73386 [Smallanthus sonchifolius]